MTKIKQQQIEAERSHWVIWLLIGLAVLFIILIAIMRGLCTDVWYIKLLGLPNNCTFSNSASNTAGLALKRTQTISLDGNKLVLSENGGSVNLDFSQSIGPQGSNGPAGSNGSQGSSGPAGPPGPPGPGVIPSCSSDQVVTANGITLSCTADQGNLQYGYDFGGSANGRYLNVTGANEPVTINTPLSTIGTPAGYNIGLAIVGDDGLLRNPSTSGTGLGKLNQAGNDAYYQVFSNNIYNFTAGNFGYVYFYNRPGTEFFQIGLNSGGGPDYGTLYFDTASTYLSSLNSLTLYGAGDYVSVDSQVSQVYLTGNTTGTGSNTAAVVISNHNTLSEHLIDLCGGLITGGDCVMIDAASGSPNGVATGNPGSLYINSTPTSGDDVLWVNSGVGLNNNGWSALSTLGCSGPTGAFCQGGNSFGTTAVLGTDDINDLEIETSGVTRITISSSGEVGIGGLPVSGKALSVNGDLKVTGVIDPVELQFSGTPINGAGYRITTLDNNPLYINTFTDRTDAVQVRQSDNTTVVFDVDTLNQRVGIGTATPTQKLDVNGDALVNSIHIGLGNNALSTNTVLAVNGLSINTTGTQNTAVGYLALAANTTGSRNTAVGWNALPVVSSGNSNTAVGGNALALDTTGSQNSAFGRGALQAITTGGNNNGFGVLALGQLSTGGNNIALGNSALNVSNGSNNVALGVLASITQTTASNNTVLGYNTGGGITTGSNNTIIGANVNGLSTTLANTVIIADGSGNRRLYADSTGNVGVGNTAPAQKLDVTGTIRQSNAISCALQTNASGDIQCVSDERLKDVQGSYVGGLEQLAAINTIKFNYKGEDWTHVGFSAQNVGSVLPEATPTQGNGYLGLDSNAVLALVVNSVKEQNGNIESINKQLVGSGLQLELISTELKKLSGVVEDHEDRLKKLEAEVMELKKQQAPVQPVTTPNSLAPTNQP